MSFEALLQIENHGVLITASNFWETEAEAAGKFFLSTNAGAFRLLVPRSQESAVSEMANGPRCDRFPRAVAGEALVDGIELLFDDADTHTPYALVFRLKRSNRLPLDTDVGREWIFTAWTAPRRHGPHKSLERPAWYRRVAKIPYLKSR